MTTLTNFFKESDSHLGVFYPTHYIIASFPGFDQTNEAAQALRKAGFSDDEVLAIPGPEVLRYFEEFREHSGLWSGVMTMLSRAFGTEQTYADADVHRARVGGGFLAIHSPEEAQMVCIKKLVEPFGPTAMHWYQAGGIQSLI
jgi:hypothetical protein